MEQSQDRYRVRRVQQIAGPHDRWRNWTADEIIRTKGELPPTVTICDGDRKTRLFRFDGNFLHNGDATDNVRILGEGDFVVAPSSLDDSTGKRRFAKGRAVGEVKIARTPHWLFEITAEGGYDIPATSRQMRRQAPSVVLVRTSEIEPERIGWLWPGIIARGKITGLVGYPGLGKSQVAINVASTVSTGRLWPGGGANDNAGEVIILGAEDNAADTIVPRLLAAGANLTDVHVVKAVRGDDGVERAFSLAVDLDRLQKEYDLQRVRLLIVDPISAYLGTAKSPNSRCRCPDGSGPLRHVRCATRPWGPGHLTSQQDQWGKSHHEDHGFARVGRCTAGGLPCHRRSRHRSAPVFAAQEQFGRRSVRLCIPHRGQGRRRRHQNVGCGVGSRTSYDHRRRGEALAAAAKGPTSGAIDFLEQVLSDGPVDQTEIVRLGKEAGYSEKNLRTAREKLGVTPKKEGFGPNGKWVWVPAGGATVLKLVVDNPANGPTAGRGGKTVPDADHAQNPETVPDPANPQSGSKKPLDGDAT